MKLLKYILNKFKCKSTCSFNENEVKFDKSILEHKLSFYELKMKDLKKINAILSKRERIVYPIGSYTI